MNKNLLSAISGGKQIAKKGRIWGVDEPPWRGVEIEDVGRNLSVEHA